MNSKIYLLLFPLLFMVFPALLHGQKQVIPGYQGKRILLGAYYNIMSASYGPNAKGKTWDRDYRDPESSTTLSFSGRLDLNASYVINRRLTGTFSVGFGQTGIIEDVLINPSTSGSTNDGLYKIGYSFAAVGIQTQRKNRWGIAPIGPYWGIRYIATKNHNPKLLLTAKKYSGDYSSVEECDCTWEELPSENNTASIFDSKLFHNVEVQFGIRNIIKKHYFYDMAFTTDPTGWFAYDSEEENIHPFETRLKRLYSINLRIGVGMLF